MQVAWCVFRNVRVASIGSVLGGLAGYGFSLGGTIEGSAGYIALKPSTFLLFGANIAVFVAIIYTGRRTYATIFRRGLGMKTDDEARPAEVWAARVFMVLLAFFVAQVAWGGMYLSSPSCDMRKSIS